MIFHEFHVAFEEPIRQFVEQSAASMGSALAKPLTVAITLYIVLYGFAIMRGAITDSVQDYAWRCIKLIIIFLLVTKAATYQEYVGGFFFKTVPDQITAVFSTEKVDDGDVFDKMSKKGYDVARKVQAEGGWTDPGPYLMGVAIFAATAIATLLMFVIGLFAKMALGLILALGPLFIALMLFSTTRRFGEAWIGTVVNFVLLQILTVALLGLVVNICQSFVDKATAATGGALIIAAVNMAASLILSAYMALQLPAIASGIAGAGASLSADFVGQAGRSARKKVASSVRGLAKLITRGA